MKEPRFWSGDIDPRSREAAPLTRLLLSPFALSYRKLTERRLRRTVPLRVPATVICVGNLTAGGVGKSPVVEALRQRIAVTYKLRVASLSRGYGGKLKGPLKVDADHHSAADVGDEPLMLAATGEAWIGADRAAAGRAMTDDGVEVIIMDDGHQNPGLQKNFTFIVIDAATHFGNGHIIPKGPLRERVDTGLKRAQAIILMGQGAVPEAVFKSGRPVLHAQIKPKTSLPQ